MEPPFRYTRTHHPERLDHIIIYILPSSDRELEFPLQDKDLVWNDRNLYDRFALSVDPKTSGAYNRSIRHAVPELHKVTKLLSKDIPLIYPLIISSLTEHRKEELMELLLAAEYFNKLCIIGNGGAGVAGMIATLAIQPEVRDNIICWSADHSFPNFKYRNCLHCAITYEPHIEELLRMRKEFYVNPLPIMNNQLGLCVPAGNDDFLNIRDILKESKVYIEEVQMSNRAAIGFAFFKGFFHALTLVHSNIDSDATQKWNGCFVSRFNHSAIGESDKTMFSLGAYEYLKFIERDAQRMKTFRKMLLIGKYESQNESLILDRMMDLWESTCVIRNPEFFPGSIMKYALENKKYLVNDAAFLHTALPAFKFDQNDLPLKFTAEIDDTDTLIIKYQGMTPLRMKREHIDYDPSFNMMTYNDVSDLNAKAASVVNIAPDYFFKIGDAYYRNYEVKLESECLVTEYLMDNFGQLWSAKNTSSDENMAIGNPPKNYDFKKTAVFKFFDNRQKIGPFIEQFNRWKCFNPEVKCNVFISTVKEKFQNVLKKYLNDIGKVIVLFKKYYLIEWIFNNHKDTGGLYPVISDKDGLPIIEKPCDHDKGECWRKDLEKKFDEMFKVCEYKDYSRKALQEKCKLEKKNLTIKCNAKSKEIADALCKFYM